MARELIKIKGGAGGFQLMIDSSAELADVQEELEKKLSEHPEFFPKGTEFQLVVADLSKSVRSGLKEFLTDKGLAVTAGDRKPLRRQEQQGSSGGRGMQPPVQTAQQSFQSEGGSRLTEEQHQPYCQEWRGDYLPGFRDDLRQCKSRCQDCGSRQH